MIVINCRVLAHPTTGVERFLEAVLAELGRPPDTRRMAPRAPLSGPAGHAWEQAVLPIAARGAALWSPANTGPLLHPRQVVTVHDVAPLDHPEWFSRRFASLYRHLLPTLCRRSRAVIAVSEFTRRRIAEVTGRSRGVEIIHPGVSPRFKPATKEEISAATRSLGLGETQYVLSIASVEPRKNLGALLAAWPALRQRVPFDLKLLIVGGAGRRSIFKSTELQPAPDGVILAGRVEDSLLPALYTGALIFCYPSIYEGFGSPPLEAMACGACVVAGTAPVFGETLGTAALRLKSSDPASIVEALARLVREPRLRSEIASAGLERSRLFSYAKTAMSTLEILRAV